MRFAVIISFLLISGQLNAQGLSNIWMGGYDNHNPIPWGGYRIDFFAGTPVISYENRVINFDFTGTNISDTNGNILFATNGVIILNNANDTMVNGKGLNPSAYTTSFNDGLRLWWPNVIVPFPGNQNKYYLFHSTFDNLQFSYADKFYYSIIDMSLDSGRGEVNTKNFILDTIQFIPNGIAACKHANGRDWWICTHQGFGTEYYFYLLTPSGASYSHTQTFGYHEGVGFYQFSPDGTKFGGYNTVDDFEIFDFDRCSGLLSNYRQVTISDSMSSSGCAFSPNSQYLYGCSIRYLYQVDVTSNQPDTTLTTVAVWDSTFYGNYAATFGFSALAPDGKIYITSGSAAPLIHAIEFPDSAGTTCNVLQHSIVLPTYNLGTVPNHPNYFLGPVPGSFCDTLTGIGENQEAVLNVSLAPNPATNNISLTYPPKPISGQIEIYDTPGQLVLNKPLPPWSQLKNLDVSFLKPGVYFIRMSWKTKNAFVKLVKQ